jgi:hypothetical protein
MNGIMNYSDLYLVLGTGVLDLATRGPGWWLGQDSHGEDEDENEDEFDKDLVYSWYGEAGHREVANKLYLMMGLKEYLTKWKIGKQLRG